LLAEATVSTTFSLHITAVTLCEVLKTGKDTDKSWPENMPELRGVLRSGQQPAEVLQLSMPQRDRKSQARVGGNPRGAVLRVVREEVRDEPSRTEILQRSVPGPETARRESKGQSESGARPLRARQDGQSIYSN